MKKTELTKLSSVLLVSKTYTLQNFNPPSPQKLERYLNYNEVVI